MTYYSDYYQKYNAVHLTVKQGIVFEERMRNNSSFNKTLPLVCLSDYLLSEPRGDF
jgi:hypothetical protein